MTAARIAQLEAACQNALACIEGMPESAWNVDWQELREELNAVLGVKP